MECFLNYIDIKMIGMSHYGKSILFLFAKDKVNNKIFGNNYICNYYKRNGHIMQDHFKSKQNSDD